MRFRKKPVVIEAIQWFKVGDHIQVEAWSGTTTRENCDTCGQHYSKHGHVETLEGGHIVCPSDWIITGVKGEFYPCKNDIFEITYEPVEG